MIDDLNRDRFARATNSSSLDLGDGLPHAPYWPTVGEEDRWRMSELAEKKGNVMRRIWLLVGLIICSSSAARGLAQSPKFVELTEDDKPYQGKVVARAADQVWLMERNGTLRTIAASNITAFRKLAESFTPISAADQRDQLRHELGNGFDIVGTGHYLVAGPPTLVRNYAEIFEDQYRAVHSYFSVRTLDVHNPEFPLVAIVFPDVASFAKYAAKDKVTVRPGLKGYYIQTTNRIALFHENAGKRAQLQPPAAFDGAIDNVLLATLPDQRLALDDLMSNRMWGNTEGDLESTMIHETTHQVAFNIGIHSRVGNINPRWVVEGLATAFETPGMRSTNRANVPGAKLNQMRLAGFREFVKQRRQLKSLARFVQSDVVFGENLLDGYAQAWALSYFLIETRPRDYARYIKLIAARPQLDPYDDQQRLADFKSAFGNDLTLLDAQFLRYIDEIK